MSLSDWMSDADYRWRQRLEPVNLVIETDFSADEVGKPSASRTSCAASSQQRVVSQKNHQALPGANAGDLVGHASLPTTMVRTGRASGTKSA